MLGLQQGYFMGRGACVEEMNNKNIGFSNETSRAVENLVVPYDDTKDWAVRGFGGEVPKRTFIEHTL